MYRWEITRAALAQRVFATIRSESYDQAAATADTLLSAGLTTLEISLTTPFALEAVTTLVREVGDDAVIGAGTVLDAVSARMAIEAGARFLLSPNLDEAGAAHRPPLRGTRLPRGRHPDRGRARDGAGRRRARPSTRPPPTPRLGRRRPRDHPAGARCCPIGGITVAAAPDWVAAGAVAVGMGSALTDGDRRRSPSASPNSSTGSPTSADEQPEKGDVGRRQLAYPAEPQGVRHRRADQREIAVAEQVPGRQRGRGRPFDEQRDRQQDEPAGDQLPAGGGQQRAPGAATAC